ncbi:beta-ketoacyl-ACP synthase III [Streptomyces sp. NPDC020362]|uniref:beta-ketoacyl-ACP synthase III n=1 Tax=unclassified Streptomyces TaxID=2593676 RepID=UPI0033F04638
MSAVSGSRISGLGGYRPRRTVTNEEIAERAPVTVEWIETRTGIHTRGHAGDGESIVDMGEHASRAALRDAGVTPEEIDLVILATQTMMRPIPSGAPELAARLGCGNAGAYDLNAACAGLTYGIAVASDAVRLGNARHVLVVGSERLTDWTTPDISDVYALLADGAGAVVVSPSDQLDIGPAVWGSAGEHREALWVPEDGEHIAMKGRQVFKWTLDNMPTAARRACALAGVELSDVAWLVLHQANRRIIDAIATELKFEPDQVARDVVDSGNTSTASIPLALCRLREEGRVRPGDRALFLGFGAGLTYAGQVVTLY